MARGPLGRRGRRAQRAASCERRRSRTPSNAVGNLPVLRQQGERPPAANRQIAAGCRLSDVLTPQIPRGCSVQAVSRRSPHQPPPVCIPFASAFQRPLTAHAEACRSCVVLLLPAIGAFQRHSTQHLLQVSSISAPAAGPSPPPIARRHHPSAHHPAGASPSRRAPPGEALKKKCSTKTEHLDPGPREIWWLAAEQQISLASKIPFASSTRCVPCADDLMPSGEWIPRASRPKG
jgi:hypothetical protein